MSNFNQEQYDELVEATFSKMIVNVAREVERDRRRQAEMWRRFFGMNPKERALNESFERRSR